jgi:hypothetical protein
MAMTDATLNRLLTTMKASFDKVYLSSGLFGGGITGLGNNISEQTITLVANPTNITLGWATASGGSIATNNTPTAGTAINFSMKASLSATTILLIDSSGVIQAVVALLHTQTAGTTGLGVFIGSLTIDISEEV